MTSITRRFVVCSTMGLVFAPSLGAARRRRVPRVGFMIGLIPGTVSPLETAFREELRRLGLIEGNNLLLEIRRSEREGDLQRQAAELGAMDLDFIVAASLVQALAVRAANPNMPMVVGTGPGFVENGFAKSLARPGGIVTGMEELTPGMTRRRLELLVAARPECRRVAILSTTPGVGGHEAQLAEGEATADRLGISLRIHRASDVARLKQAMMEIARDEVDGLLSFQGGLALGQRHAIVRFAQAQRIPAVYQSELFVRAGGFMSFAPDQEEQFRIAAKNAAKVIAGTPPGSIPIVHPAPYFVTLNRTAAAAIGLTLPDTLLAQADRVFDRPLEQLTTF